MENAGTCSPKKSLHRSHNLKYDPLLIELGQDLIYEIYEELDRIWDITGFIPCPIPMVADKFKTTYTHITLVMLAWRESRMKKEIYGTI